MMKHTDTHHRQKEACPVIRQEQIATGIYSLWLQTATIAKKACPGQFVMLYCQDGSRILPRPISICQTKGDTLRLVYRVAGAGTAEFSKLQPEQTIDILGPLGNGYPLAESMGKKTLLLGGGIGIPPLLETAAHMGKNAVAVLGYRDEVFLNEDFEKICSVVLASEKGVDGCIHGNVLDAVQQRQLQAEQIFACGPTPMLRAVKHYAEEHRIPCWLSLEERMACGIGACLGCVCDSTDEDTHSHVHRKRVCKDGPVFLSTEITL